MKRIISLSLVLSLILSFISVGAVAAGVEWPEVDPYKTRITPVNDYHSFQNPPSFKWAVVDGAVSYDIKICTDKELNNIKYEKAGIKTNYYNFPYTFEAGEYFWSYRFTTKDGTSDWCEPRRFLLDRDALEFPVPETVDEMLKNATLSHPRIIFNSSNLEAEREKALSGNYANYTKIIDTARRRVGTDMPTEPTTTSTSYINEITSYMRTTALGYLLTKEKDVGEHAKKVALTIASWDPDGITSFPSHDQIGRAIMVNLAITYDWIYDILSDDDKAKLIENIEIRVQQIFDSNSLGVKGMLEGDPYSSHGWTAAGYVLETAVALLYDSSDAKGWFEELLPFYINLYVPWSTEDGGWSQGAYYRHSAQHNNEASSVLQRAGIIDLYKKTWAKNELYYMLYFWPKGSLTLFGDEDDLEVNSNTFNFATNKAVFTPSPLAKWFRNQYEYIGLDGKWFMAEDRIYEPEEVKEPTFMEKAKYLKDIGWIGSHSDLIDTERISLYFKSSWYGGYSHSHSDQNSFVIDAFGERLALDSGYYDGWGSAFDRGYSRQTYAHNTITHSDGVGQPTMDITSKGEITEFITTPDFDLLGGDATGAYADKIGKFKRNIIYLRPDQFLVIDDLAAKDGEETTFEWWLNAEKEIYVHDNLRGAKIVKNDAALDAKVMYPENITPYYSNTFSGVDHTAALTPSGSYASQPVHQRVWFQTDKVEKTKIVTAMDVHKTDEASKYVRQTETNGILKLEFEDGSTVYINIADKEEASVDGYTFSGTALAVKNNTLMLIDGTKLFANGKTVFESDVPVSVATGRERLGISSISKDAKIKVLSPDLTKVTQIIDEEEREILKDNSDNLGITWTTVDENYAEFSVYPGTYTLYLNGKERPGTTLPGEDVSFTVYVDNEPTEFSIPTYQDEYDNDITKSNIKLVSDFYMVEEISDNAFVGGLKEGEFKVLPSDLSVEIDDGNSAYIKLTSVRNEASVTQADDYNAVKNNATVFIEAENFDSKTNSGKVYTTRAFMSGGAGVSEFNTIGDNMTWKVKIPESGNYKLGMNIVAWDSTTPSKRIAKIGGNILSFTLPFTSGYGSSPEQWTAAVVDTPIYLEAGEYDFTVWVKQGSWNLDWFTFTKI